MSNLPSVGLVIDALGGNQHVAELLDTNGKVVSWWRSTGKFPANTWVVIHKQLNKMGLTAPDELWAMRGQRAPRLRKAIQRAIDRRKVRKKR
jgi:hypothetical protein